jgi:hypothetical protein
MGARETDDFIAEERSDQSYFRSAGCSSPSPDPFRNSLVSVWSALVLMWRYINDFGNQNEGSRSMKVPQRIDVVSICLVTNGLSSKSTNVSICRTCF